MRTAPPSLSPTLIKFGWRHLSRTPWQSLLMVLGIMLGVGVVVAIDLANGSASKAFDLSTEAVAGKATHVISGSPQGLDEDIYAELKREGTSYPLAPVVTQYVVSPQLGELPLQLLGIDPFAEAPFRSYLSSNGETLSLQALTDFLTVPGAVLLSSDLAQRFSLAPGSKFTLKIGGLSREAEVVGLINPDDDLSRRGLNSLILADIATAQELTGQTGTLDRIDLILPEDDPAAAESIRQKLPAGVVLQPTSVRSGAITQMTAAFRTNLTALSLLALIVGVFLIYNTMTFSVVRRREMFGTLRTLGLTRREIFLLVLQEAFIVGAIGSILGIGLGLVLGQGAVRLVTQTINDLFFTLTVQEIAVPYFTIIKGALIGIAATMAAAAPPAWEAASITPRQALLRSGLEDKTKTIIRYASLVGMIMTAIGAVIFLVPKSSLSLLGLLYSPPASPGWCWKAFTKLPAVGAASWSAWRLGR